MRICELRHHLSLIFSDTEPIPQEHTPRRNDAAGQPCIHAEEETFTMAESSYDRQPKLGIPPETAVPLISLISVGIGALIVVLVLLARDKRVSD